MFVGRSTGQRGLREERKNWLKMGCEFWECLAAPSHRTQLPGCVGQPFFRKKKWFVLRQRIVFDHMPHFHPFLLPHWEIQSTPLPPYSSMLTCWNSFKSSTHCFSHLAGDYQHAPWCNTLTKNLLCSICFPDTKIETLQAQWLSFPQVLDAETQTSLLMQGRKFSPPQQWLRQN